MKTSWKVVLAGAGIAGCAVGAPPIQMLPSPPSQTTIPAPIQTYTFTDTFSSPSPAVPMAPQPSSRYSWADPKPTVALDPKNPCAGAAVKATATGLPAGQAVEWWLTPESGGGFKGGPIPPEQMSGIKLGESDADASGAAKLTFTFAPPAQYDLNVPRGYYVLWLVYKPGTVLAPFVVSWQCPTGTRFSGRVLDANGRPVPPGATVEIKISTDGGDLLFDKTTPVVDGSYVLDGVPAPATTEITAHVPGWPARTRTDGIGGLQSKWAGYPQGPTNGNVFSNTQGDPLIFNFGGPSVPTDPDAPGYFLAADLDAPDMATATLSGHVYDQQGQLVPDGAGLKVIVSAGKFRAQVDVHDGSYVIPGVPTGVSASVDLRINPVYPLFSPPNRVLIPPKVLGHANILNFGGPATPEDPEAPKYPYPSPSPQFTGPSPFTPP
ncbi:MAG: hypothetical protein JWM80_5900 [Cyanobacteria bacterium RYN_339]|nr:hypothetical protein [Cyanobacteria bacterium RYN_339]